MFNQFNVENKWKTYTDKIISVSGELFVENDVDVSGNLEVQDDASINGITIGNVYSGSGWYGIRNSSLTGNTDFALLQHTSGDTVLNASSGKTINFRIDNSDKVTINSNGRIHLANLAIANVSDSSSTDATVKVSHIAFSGNSTSYSLLQNSSGDTVVNAASGRKLYLRINDSTKATLDTDYFYTGHINVGEGWVGAIRFTNISGYENRARIETSQTSNNWSMYFYVKALFNLELYTSATATNTDGHAGRQVKTVHLYPASDNVWDLGSSSLRWKKVYAASSSISTSDDRLKINETPINNSLEFIRNIDFYEYDKVHTVDGNDIDFRERGVVAQHLIGTELEYILEGGQEEDIEDTSGNITRQYIPYGIRYNDIFVTNCKATKELDILVQAQETKISNLEAENNLLKSKLNEILSEMGKETI